MELQIRRMRESDADILFRLLSDPKVMRCLEPPFDRAQAEAFLRDAGLAEPPRIYAAEDGGRFLGYVIFHPYGPDSLELGWVLLPEFWGRGYASALTDLLLRRVRQAGKAAVIECVPEQAATRHLARRKGFSFLGISGGLAVYRLPR